MKERNMNKFKNIAVAATLALTLTACGGGEEAPEAPVAAETTEAPAPAEETTEPVEEKPDLLERTNEAAEVASEQGLECLDATLVEEADGAAASAPCKSGDGWLTIIYTQDGDVQDVLFESAKELWNEEAAAGSVTWDFYTVDGVDEQFTFMGTVGVLYEVGTVIEQEMNVVME